MNLTKICTSWKLWAGIALVLAFLLFQKGADIIAYLPFAILLICPLMMIFMKGSHGGHKDK